MARYERGWIGRYFRILSLAPADAGVQAGGWLLHPIEGQRGALADGRVAPSVARHCVALRHLPLAGEDCGAGVSASERSDGVEGDPHQAFRDAEDRIGVVQALR